MLQEDLGQSLIGPIQDWSVRNVKDGSEAGGGDDAQGCCDCRASPQVGSAVDVTTLALLKISPVPTLQEGGEVLRGNERLPQGRVCYLGEFTVDGNDCVSVTASSQLTDILNDTDQPIAPGDRVIPGSHEVHHSPSETLLEPGHAVPTVLRRC
jgi:hypothetical protein